MGFLVILLIALFVAVLIAPMGVDTDSRAVDEKAKFLNGLGVCPPHKWRHVEVKDHEGVTHAWKMVCDRCGPLKPLDNGADS